MNLKIIVKIGVDIVMTVALLLLMAYQLIGDETHEWIGIVMFLFFVTHHVLNMAWSKNLIKGKYNARRIIQTLFVFLILLCMIGSMVSGIVLSRYVFASLEIHGGVALARSVHMLCAYCGFVFMSLHLGFHWNMMIGMAGRLFAKKSGQYMKAGIIIMRVLAALIAGYGCIAFRMRDIWNYLTLKNQFVFFDFSEPVIFFLLDYLAVMGLFVFIGHYLSKGLLWMDRSFSR